MTNQELIVELSKRIQLTQKDVSALLEATVKIVTQNLEDKNSINIQGFGLFETKERKERISVNPLSQQRYIIPPKISVTFKPGQSIKEKLRKIDIEN